MTANSNSDEITKRRSFWVDKGYHLFMKTNVSCKNTELYSLLLLQHVFQVRNRATQSHALNGRVNLTAMLEMQALAGHAGLASKQATKNKETYKESERRKQVKRTK